MDGTSGTIESVSSGRGNSPATTLMKIPLDQVAADAQVRIHFDDEAMGTLTESLKTSGQIVPILAYHDRARSKYVIVDGERRFRAAKAAEFPVLEALVFGVKPTPQEIALVQLTIDAQREDLDPLDQALAYSRVMETCGLSASDLAAQLHVSHTTITRAVSLLTLPDELQAEIRADRMSPSVARELARLPDEATQRRVWETVQARSMSAEQTQKLVARLLKPKKKAGKSRPKSTLTFRHLGGFDAVVTAKKITLTPSSSAKPRTREQMLAALEMLASKLREEIAKSVADVGEAEAATLA